MSQWLKWQENCGSWVETGPAGDSMYSPNSGSMGWESVSRSQMRLTAAVPEYDWQWSAAALQADSIYSTFSSLVRNGRGVRVKIERQHGVELSCGHTRHVHTKTCFIETIFYHPWHSIYTFSAQPTHPRWKLFQATQAHITMLFVNFF